MKLIFAFVLVLVSAVSSFSQYTWTAQTSNSTDFMRAISFATSGSGLGLFGTANGEIGRTTDGGDTWGVSYNVPLITGNSFSNWVNGMYIDDQKGAFSTNGGQIYTSSDAGQSWSLAYSNGLGSYMYDLQYSNGRLLASGNNIIYFSNDFGVTWDSVVVACNNVYAMSFFGDNGVAVGGTQVFKTSDLGDTWVELSGLPHSFPINSVEMTSSSVFFTVGDAGEIQGSNNFGVGWESTISSGTTENLSCIEFGSSTHGVITGANGIVLMTDAGGFDPWTNSPHGGSMSQSILALHVNDEAYAWFASNNGDIYTAPDPNYDIEIISFSAPDTICFDADFDFSIQFTAILGDAVNPEFQILLDGYSLFGSYVVYDGVVPYQDTVEMFLNATPTNTNPVETANTVSIQGYNLQQDFIAWYFPVGDSIYLKDYDPYTISGPHEFCPGDFISIEATGGDSYSWTGNVDDPLLPSNIVFPIVNTNYLVTIQQEYCSVTDTVFTILASDCDTDTTITPVPASAYAFSPNGDSVNDFFVLDYLDGTTNNVQIFNRWGDLLAEFDNYNNDSIVWDGTFNGVKVGGGTYYFIVEYGDNLSSSGWVQVVE